MKKLFLIGCLFCIVVFGAETNIITQKIKLVKDQTIIYNYFGGVSSLNISGKDDKNKNWHWVLYYRNFVGPKGLGFEPGDIRQIKPDIDNLEIFMLQYKVRYETKVTSQPPKIFTMEDKVIKSENIEVTIVYKKRENPIEKQ